MNLYKRTAWHLTLNKFGTLEFDQYKLIKNRKTHYKPNPSQRMSSLGPRSPSGSFLSSLLRELQVFIFFSLWKRTIKTAYTMTVLCVKHSNHKLGKEGKAVTKNMKD